MSGGAVQADRSTGERLVADLQEACGESSIERAKQEFKRNIASETCQRLRPIPMQYRPQDAIVGSMISRIVYRRAEPYARYITRSPRHGAIPDRSARTIPLVLTEVADRLDTLLPVRCIALQTSQSADCEQSQADDR